MTKNTNFIKRLIFSFLVVALMAVPGVALAQSMPDAIKKDMLETGKRSILKDASGVMGLRGAEMALLLTACSPGPETSSRVLSRSALRIQVSSQWKQT